MRIPKKPPPALPPLDRALDQSEQVQDKVERAAAGLSSVNAKLVEHVDGAIPRVLVARALEQSRGIEAKVQEAATELVTINDALAEEIVERRHLQDQLSHTQTALSESRADAEESRHAALHDAVTGLPNLTLFNDRLRNALAQAERHVWRLAVMFIDLDDFKQINDTHGHDAGDRVLKVVAQRLEAIVRGGDTVSRRSGDEFLFLMVEAKDESSVAALVARIAGRLAETYEIDGAELTLRASIGIALYPDDGRSSEELLKRADAAMYAAKDAKKSAPT